MMRTAGGDLKTSELYVGLDVALAKTAVCVVDGDGRKVWAGTCASDPATLIRTVRRHAPAAVRVGLETGPLAVWHWYALEEAGLPVVCLHARQVQAALSLQPVKTDPNDAYGIAQVVRTGWFRPVTLKSRDSYRLRLLLGARERLVRVRTTLYNQIRGLVKTFGVVLPPGKGGTFVTGVTAALERQLCAEPTVALVVQSQLAVWSTVDRLVTEYTRRLEQAARADAICQRLRSVPGVGVLTALAFRTTIDDPTRFGSSADVAAYLGLTPSRYQSGAVDRGGGITKCGDVLTRALLFEAAHCLLTRSRQDTRIRRWGREIAARSGYRKASVAVARKLAVILFSLWRDGTRYSEVVTAA